MTWDRSWNFRKKSFTIQHVKQAAEQVIDQYQGVLVRVEKEAEDCITCFFSIPSLTPNNEPKVIEISIYHMGKNTYILSLETDASDNRTSEDADQLAEDLAAVFSALPLEE